MASTALLPEIVLDRREAYGAIKFGAQKSDNVDGTVIWTTPGQGSPTNMLPR